MSSSQTFHPVEIIQRKRDGRELSDREIEAFIDAVVKGAITDAQTAALLMAIVHHGLSPRELATLTGAMRHSGEVFDSTPLHTLTVDKHSTGGVGDKTSLLIAPILAAAGLAAPTSFGTPGLCVPMISGRSLGHTGGTLDKLETIPGFDTQLSLAQFSDVLQQCGAALIGQTPTLVPADRILYALRDHTGTVESPYLICASIMSKKLAEGLNALVLDVKTGSGAFMPTYADSKLLAQLMVETGEANGTRTVALLTTHDEPLGRFAGNWLEVRECVDIMQQRRHPLSSALIELTNILSGWMLHLAGHAATPQAGAAHADGILQSGAAYRAWLEIVAAQGGETSAFDAPETLHRAAATRVLTASCSGYLSSMDCRQVGWAVQRLGAGRTRPGAPVSAAAGIEMHAKLGDRIVEGQRLITLYADDDSLLSDSFDMLRETLTIAHTQFTAASVVREIVMQTQS